jgi:hypothetical protein
MRVSREPDAPPHHHGCSCGGGELMYLAKTAAYELALVRRPAGPPVVCLRGPEPQPTLRLTVAEVDALAGAVAHLRDYLRQEGRPRGRPVPSGAAGEGPG